MTAEEIDTLFKTACDTLNKPESSRRDWWIFQQVMGDTPKALRALGTFLKDMSTCPQEVLAFCQQILAPKSTSIR